MNKKHICKDPTDLEYKLENIPPANVMAPLVIQQLAMLSSNQAKEMGIVLSISTMITKFLIFKNKK